MRVCVLNGSMAGSETRMMSSECDWEKRKSNAVND